jgi:competence protein ComEC
MKGSGILANGYLLLILTALISAGICGCTAPAPLPRDGVHAVPDLGFSPISTPGTVSAHSTAPAGILTVRFLDVGLGDALLIGSPSGKTMLIDAGSGLRSQELLSDLDTAGITTLDVVLATHPHEDHIGGMDTVLTSYPVGQFIDAGIPHTTVTYQNLMKRIAAKNIPYRRVRAGDTIILDPGVTFRVENPDGTLLPVDENENVAENLNENSIVLTLTYGNITFLLMGDATVQAERLLLQKSGGSMHADILKVAHHGSGRSSGPGFLAAVRPAVCIIEVGSPNPYGYPSPATLSRLSDTGSSVYRTDLHGTIIITTDGSTYQVFVERGAPVPDLTLLPGAASVPAWGV